MLLQPAFASRIHQVYGQTLSSAFISITAKTSANYAYAMISRVSDPAGLQLREFDSAGVKTSGQAVGQFYETLQVGLARPCDAALFFFNRCSTSRPLASRGLTRSETF